MVMIQDEIEAVALLLRVGMTLRGRGPDGREYVAIGRTVTVGAERFCYPDEIGAAAAVVGLRVACGRAA